MGGGAGGGVAAAQLNRQGDEAGSTSSRTASTCRHTPGAARVDLASLRPSPYHVPIIMIHSPGPDIASKTKAISRQHLKIEFNIERGVLEAIPLHKNGFFRDDFFYTDQALC